MNDNLTSLIIPAFNIVIGIIGILIGFKIYKPFKKDKAEAYHKKYSLFFTIGGVGMLIWGIINLLKLVSN